MRKLLSLVLSMIVLSLSAQEILVNSFQEKPYYELTGSEIQKDANGSTCALINVYFDEKDASFEGSYVVGNSMVGNSYQVFLAGGASKMVIKHTNYLPTPIVFADYGINKLESNKVYEIKLMGDKTSNAFNKDIASENFEYLANAGDAKAQYNLGKQYYLGISVEQDYNKAISWFEKSAKQGNIDAIYNLGLCYYYGQGVNQNYDYAIEYFKTAAHSSHAMAQFKYAVCLNNGLGQQGKNISEAITWYEKAASQNILNAKNNVAILYLSYDPTGYLMGTSDKNKVGFPQYYNKGIKYLNECIEANITEAYLNLGNIYLDGIVIEKDEKRAIEYYQKAADNGLYLAYHNIGRCYYNGLGVKTDEKKAFEYFQISATKGLSEGFYSLALCYHYGKGTKKNTKKAIEYYQKASDLNNPYAITNLGSMYLNGEGVKQDINKASELFLKGGEKGDPTGYANLGVIYHEKQDMTKAIEYYQKAADMGNYIGLINLAVIYQSSNNGLKAIEYYERAAKMDQTGAAYYNWGTIYYFGCGEIAKNHQKAYELFTESANANYAPAQYNLGVMYLNGEYVTKNENQAISLIKKAAKQNYKLAVDYIKQLNQAKMQYILGY